MDFQSFIEHSLHNAILLNNYYNTPETSRNLEYIKFMIEKIKELKTQNRELNLNYNQLIFDFAIYRADTEDKKKQKLEIIEETDEHDSIDIY
jgi:hypothetical protein